MSQSPRQWANVRIDPVVDYVQQVFLRSVAKNTQRTFSLNDFKLEAVGNAKITINGTLSITGTITTDVHSKIVIDETVVNQMRTDLPPLFANILVSGEVTNDLSYRLQTAITQVVTVQNLQNIIQSTFDVNKGKMYFRNSMVVFDSDLEVSQNISTKVLAVNVIKSIIDLVGDISTSVPEPPPKKNQNWIIFAIIGGLLSMLCFILILVLLVNGGSSKRSS